MGRFRDDSPGGDETETRPAGGVRRPRVARPSRWTADPTGNVELWHALDEHDELTACGLVVPASWPKVGSLPPTVFDRQDLLCWQCGSIRRRRLTQQ